MAAKGTVLIVEDDEAFRTSLKTLFEREGFTTLEAGSGHEAVTLLGKEAVNLVILDYYLGDMTGLEFLGVTEGLSRVPVIVLTAFGDWGIYGDVIARGAVDCIAKPVKREALMRVVKTALCVKQR